MTITFADLIISGPVVFFVTMFYFRLNHIEKEAQENANRLNRLEDRMNNDDANHIGG